MVFETGNFSIQHRGSRQAYYASCAGAEYGRYIIKHSATYNPPTDRSKWPIGTNGVSFDPFGNGSGNTAVLNIQAAGSGYRIISIGTSSTGQTNTLTVLTTSDGVPTT